MQGQAPPGAICNCISDQLAEITNTNGSGPSANYCRQPVASFNCNTNGQLAGEDSFHRIDFSQWNIDDLLSRPLSQITGGDLGPPPLLDTANDVQIAHFNDVDDNIEAYLAASLPASPLPDDLNTFLSNSSGSIPAPAICSVPLQGSATTVNPHEPHIHDGLERTLSLVDVLTDDDFLPDLLPPNASDTLVANIVPDFRYQSHGPPAPLIDEQSGPGNSFTFHPNTVIGASPSYGFGFLMALGRSDMPFSYSGRNSEQDIIDNYNRLSAYTMPAGSCKVQQGPQDQRLQEIMQSLQDILVENPSNAKSFALSATACNIGPTYSTQSMSHNEKMVISNSAALMEFSGGSGDIYSSLSYQSPWQKHPKESASICNGGPVSPKWPASVTSKEDSSPEEVFEMAEGNMVATVFGPNEATSKRKRDSEYKMNDRIARTEQYASGGDPIKRTRKESSCGARTTSISAHDLVDPSSIAGVANAAYLLSADGEEMNPSNEDKDKSRVQFLVKTNQLFLDDGFTWKKYGTKIVKVRSQMCTRNYYRCAEAERSKCEVAKYVLRFPDCPGIVECLYFGRHSHPAQLQNGSTQPSSSHN